MTNSRVAHAIAVVVLMFSVGFPASAQLVDTGSSQDGFASGPLRSLYDPPWSNVKPAATLTFDRVPALSDAQNGANLKAVIQALLPGQRLEIGGGTYAINSFFSIELVGSLRSPIWIVAKTGETPILTRSDASQNVVNLGGQGPARYVALSGLEITGGSEGVRLSDAENVWIDRCHIHATGNVGISARTLDTAYLYLTRNRIHDTAGTGEGIYLGSNNGTVVTAHSVIALNHVRDTGGSQGDGIELKQGSYDNWIVGNLVHDTPYPCILVYGTDGNPVNVIEGNVCFRSGDNVLQVQGEALVRNNLLVGGIYGFQSHDHQGQTRELTFVHNTILNTGRGANLQDWGGRSGMVFANNVVYSLTDESLHLENGAAGVTMSGNVVLGPVNGASSGFQPGAGLADFVNAAWDASALDARPSTTGALPGTADTGWLVPRDLSGAPLAPPFESGCLDGI